MTTRNLAAVAGLAALTALPGPPAHALNLTTPASACRPYNDFRGEDIEALAFHEVQPGYTANTDPDRLHRVLCPIARFGDGNGVTVLIRGHKLPTLHAPLYCTVYSYRPGVRGALKFIRLSAPSGSPSFVMTFTFTAEEAPAEGYLNAVCDVYPERDTQGRLFHFQTVD